MEYCRNELRGIGGTDNKRDAVAGEVEPLLYQYLRGGAGLPCHLDQSHVYAAYAAAHSAISSE